MRRQLEAVMACFAVVEDAGERVCVALGGEKVTIAPVEPWGIEAIVALAPESWLPAREALVISRSLPFGALVVVGGNLCLRQVLPRQLLGDGQLVIFVRAAATAARAIRGRIARLRPRLMADHFGLY